MLCEVLGDVLGKVQGAPKAADLIRFRQHTEIYKLRIREESIEDDPSSLS